MHGGDHGNHAIERVGNVHIVFEDVHVEETIGISKGIRAEVQARGVLRQTMNVLGCLERDIDRNRSRAPWLGIDVAIESLLPDVRGVHISGVHQTMMLQPSRTVALEIHQMPTVHTLEHASIHRKVKFEGCVAHGDRAAPWGGHHCHVRGKFNSHFVKGEALLRHHNLPVPQPEARVQRVTFAGEDADDATALTKVAVEAKLKV
mmetsp:Transcript_43433/g.114480  ORF Transcript_43433/g.114480 Transcript_43433/m.114480 type:complete len:204 (+) Transcript_43433:2071-2682(+)